MPIETKKHKIQGYRTTLVKDRSAIYRLSVGKLECAEHVVAAAKEHLLSQPHESVLCFWLNADNCIIGMQEVARGGAYGCSLTPADVFRGAIVAGASAVVLAHNHPSGCPEPSKDDIAMTKLCAQAGEVVGIIVLDHVVVAKGGSVSLFQRGLF